MPSFLRLAVWLPSISPMELCCGPKQACRSASSPTRHCLAGSATLTLTRFFSKRAFRHSLSLKDSSRNRSSVFLRRCATTLADGSIACGSCPATSFPRKSQRFVRKWRCMGDTRNLVRAARKRSSASVTRPTKPTTVRTARPGVSCLPIALCRDCCARTGLELRRSLNCLLESDGECSVLSSQSVLCGVILTRIASRCNSKLDAGAGAGNPMRDTFVESHSCAKDTQEWGTRLLLLLRL